MKTWAEFEAAAPDVAGLGRKLLRSCGKAMLATVRADGAPRVSPICPVLSGTGLFAVIIMATPKYRDLIRDGRCVLHTPPMPGDAEFAVEGVARALGAGEAAGTGIAVPGGDALFQIMIASAYGVLYRPGSDGLAVPVCRRWREQVAA